MDKCNEKIQKSDSEYLCSHDDYVDFCRNNLAVADLLVPVYDCVFIPRCFCYKNDKKQTQ